MIITDAMIEAGARAIVGSSPWNIENARDIAKAALVAAEKAAWRPIEEAPDDGTPILVTGGAKHGQQVNCVPADGGWWRMQIGQLSAIPTHFRPLPTPGEPDER